MMLTNEILLYPAQALHTLKHQIERILVIDNHKNPLQNKNSSFSIIYVKYESFSCLVSLYKTLKHFAQVIEILNFQNRYFSTLYNEKNILTILQR